MTAKSRIALCGAANEAAPAAPRSTARPMEDPERSAPMEAASGQTAARAPRPSEPVSGRCDTRGGTRGRVLIVEEEAQLSRLLKRVLELEGYEVELAADGAEGLRRAEATPPDLVLLDADLVFVDALTATERLRRGNLTCGLPIVVLSAANDPFVRVRALGLGASDFVAKPFFLPELLARIERSLQQAENYARLANLVLYDELTGLGNLRLLHERLRIEEARAARYGTPLSVVMADVDQLKRINDELGHTTGSRVLASIGTILQAERRPTDTAVRYGGDEFLVLLPHTGLEDGLSFADRVLKRLRQVSVESRKVSMSLGVASNEGATAVSAEELVRRADVAAYQAKHAGGGLAFAFFNEAAAVPER